MPKPITPKPSYQDEAREILKTFLAKSANYENGEMLLLSAKWGGVSTKLEDLIKQLSEKEVPTLDQLYRLDLYKEFLKLSNDEVTKYTKFANGLITEGQIYNAKIGLDIAQETIGIIHINYNRINFDAVNYMIGKSAYDGAPLYNLLKTSYPDTVDRLSQTLINGTALGWNPTKTAKAMAADMDGNLTRALRIARTEQLNVLRESSIEQMKQSGVCKGWIRVEASDCCEICAEVNGKHYSFNETFDTHPNCRGATIPDM